MTKRFTQNQIQQLKGEARKNNLEIEEATKMHFTVEASDGRKIMAHKDTRREKGGPVYYTAEYHDRDMGVQITTFDEFKDFKEFIRDF